jgi:hypothetical protein
VDLSGLTANEVTTLVRRQGARFQPHTSQAMTTALRVFFRFAQQRGDLTTDLAAVVPAVAHCRPGRRFGGSCERGCEKNIAPGYQFVLRVALSGEKGKTNPSSELVPISDSPRCLSIRAGRC